MARFLPRFKGGGSRSFDCKQDPNTRKVICKSFRKNKDGTEEELARIEATADAQCNPVYDDASENKEGELKILEDWARPRINIRCKNMPSDY